VWHVPSGRTLASLAAGRGLTCLAFSADGQQLAAGTLGGRLAIWQPRTANGARDFTTLTSPLEAVALSADGEALAATGRDGSIWLRRLAQPATPAPPVAVRSLPTPSRVISSSYRLFDWLRRVALL
jgi:WD40 repeat protein